jgi:hypothetical protein
MIRSAPPNRIPGRLHSLIVETDKALLAAVRARDASDQEVSSSVTTAERSTRRVRNKHLPGFAR